MPDIDAAARFMAGHARLLDLRRFDVIVHGGPPDGALAALSAYRNPDSGYSWGLEPDLRAAESQPAPALHAFEVFEDVLPATSPRAGELCDWLESVSLPDGGLPFALPIAEPAACAPFWAGADPTSSSPQITAIVTAMAHRAAAGDPAIAAHPWLARATEYCVAAAAALPDDPPAMTLAFTVQALDAAHRTHAGAADAVARLARHVPADGLLHVAGGLEDEMMRPLDFAPLPGGPGRELFAPEIVEAELERLAGRQQEDGGWPEEFASYSPQAALEWRGHLTVRALAILKRNGAL
jgi:hypothetical protein